MKDVKLPESSSKGQYVGVFLLFLDKNSKYNGIKNSNRISP